MAAYVSRGPPNGSIYVCNLPPGTDETMLAEYFGTIGLLKKDKRTGQPKIWIYRDKATNEPKGDATVTYEDQHAASAAVEWFNNKDFHGSIIQVHIAVPKNKDTSDNSMNLSVTPDLVEQDELDNGSGRGSGRGDGPAKAWQQDGDWMCPNASCGNVNFAFRGVCNRCGASRPAGVSGSGGGGGRGRGRDSDDARGSSRAPAVGGPPGLFGPNDWACTMCGNVNWAKRTKCNVCNTSKPGHNEGGVRGGRGGGYKELDEEELEEVRRRRKEADEDDGEIYDEFGNLKKKFRVKSQQTESAPALPQSGRAGWEVEHRVSTERESRERSRDRGRDAYDERESRNRDRGGHGRERRRSRSRSRDREKERGRDRARDHGSDRSWERGSERGHDRYR